MAFGCIASGRSSLAQSAWFAWLANGTFVEIWCKSICRAEVMAGKVYAPWKEVREGVLCLLHINWAMFFFPTDDIIIPETLQPGVEDQVLYLPGRDAEAAIHKRRNNQQFRCFSSRGGPRSSPGTLKCLNHGTT